MPDQLAVTGGITKSLLNALDQIHAAISAGLVDADGKPSHTAVYMHLPVGQPVDPKMYADPWTPAGGDAYHAVNNDGTFAQPTTAPSAGPTTAPAAQVAAAGPDPKLQLAISSAYNTARRVDDMLMVTTNGVAVAWPQRTVSIEYFTALTGMQAEPVPEPSADIKARIADAEKVLYTVDADGNYTGYSALYASYRHNQKALADARSDFALAYSHAMADPVEGQAWPVTSSRYQNAVDQAYNDLKDMGGQRVEDAIATLQSIGGSAAAALIAKARKLFDDYSVALSGAISSKTPWSYIDPVSWWDHTNQDYGVMRISASASQYDAASNAGSSSFSSSFYRDSSSSNSGSAGADVFLFGGSVDASHTESSHDDGSSSASGQYHQFRDQSSDATVEFEWFIASIERPWLLGDLFHIDGWYLAGQKAGVISDGTIDGQVGKEDRLLPMLPKAFVIIRNVKITSTSWGDLGTAFATAQEQANGHTDAESTSFGGSAHYLCFSGSFQHSESDDSGAFSRSGSTASGMTYTTSSQGGTLELKGSQIVGWIGQIQPSSPRKDDPQLAAKDSGATTTTTDTAPATAPVAPQL